MGCLHNRHPFCLFLNGKEQTMNKLTYRFSLDTHKNGVQRTLQGFESSDSLSTVLEISLTENGVPYDIPKNAIYAVLYVKKPSGLVDMESVIFENNTLVCELSETTLQNPGITECQIRLLDSANKAIVSPRFDIEVWESIVSPDEEAKGDDKNTFERLEQAIIDAGKARGSAIISVDFKDKSSEDYTLVFEKEDGTAYEVDGLTELMAYIKEHAKGVPGDAATIRVGTVTSGEVAKVTNVGTEQEAVFNFELPRGEQGEKGDVGNSGVYIGADEPSDANVWIDPNGEADDFITEDMLDGESVYIGEDGLVHAKGGGGEGGTNNYNELINLPKVNGVTLSGNKSLADLGIESAITSKGYQTSADVEGAISAKGYQTSAQVNSAITSKGYQTETQVNALISSAIGDAINGRY